MERIQEDIRSLVGNPHQEETINLQTLANSNKDTAKYEDSSAWKSSLAFTGRNPTYPVELFVRIMERKYGLLSKKKRLPSNGGKQNHSAASNNASRAFNLIIQHIPDEGDSPATQWKRAQLKKQKIPNCWRNIKKDMIRSLSRRAEREGKNAFTLPSTAPYYCMRDKLLLFDSLVKGRDEKLSTYCIRAYFVASILEHSSVRFSRG